MYPCTPPGTTISLKKGKIGDKPQRNKCLITRFSCKEIMYNYSISMFGNYILPKNTVRGNTQYFKNLYNTKLKMD
jgi:hypothetical protein